MSFTANSRVIHSIDEKPDSALIPQEEDSDTDEATELQEMEAESEPEQEKVDLRVKAAQGSSPSFLKIAILRTSTRLG